ncbi:MAG: 2-hydroxychromene-2-carboxylate isomerase [Polyangiales bacterium]
MRAEFLFDVASPNAYLAYRVLPALEQRTGVRFERTPVLLGGIFKATHNRSPLEAFAGVPSKLAYERRELTRFVARHGIAFEMNPHFPVNSLLVMRILTAASLEDHLAPYLEALMQHMWQTPRKLDEPEQVRAVLDEAGLEAERMLARAQEPAVKATLLERTSGAVARGAFGLPTFFVNGEMFFGKDRLRDVEDEVERVKRSA